jgi:hypothetical protein
LHTYHCHHKGGKSNVKMPEKYKEIDRNDTSTHRMELIQTRLLSAMARNWSE